MLYVVGSIVIFVIVLLIFMARGSENTLLKGFWRADADFCNNAELEMFVLYISDNTGYINHTRNGYILAANKQGIILNNPITLSFSGGVHFSPMLVGKKNYTVTIDWNGSPPEDSDAFPSKLQLTYYPKHCKIVLHKDDLVLAALWKDCQMSAMTSSEALLPDGVIDHDAADKIADLDDLADELT